MKRLLALMLFLLLIPEAAFAQAGALVVATCGSLPQAYPAGSTRSIVVDVNGNLCSGVNATITGFAPASTGSPISVTTGGNTGTLPSGAVVTAFNIGATNTAFCKLGASATTGDVAIPPASWFAFTVGAATQLTCITSASTTTVNMVGGSGLPTGAGGGGGGSGGAVTIADGADVTLGAKADAAAGTGTVTAMAILKQLHLDVTAAIPTGTNVIGFTSNDPCSQATKLGAPIFATGSTQIIAGVSAKKTYICSADLITASAQNIALVEGTGTVCATNIFGLAGGTTAASGWNLAANGGLTKGSGSGTVYSPSADSNGTAANICLLLSGSATASGHFTYVQQ
jgi:hypothetical protein